MTKSTPFSLGLFLFLQIAFFTFCLGQDSTLLEFNMQRTQVNKTGMWVLGGWAVANIAGGAWLRSQSTGTSRYVHEMNLMWNVVNLGLAGAGLYGAFRANPADLSLWESLSEQQNIEKILLFNAALDIGYMVGGAYMIERSRRVQKKPERIKGYGQSLILQGGFLLVFDSVLYLVHAHSSSPQIQKLLSQVSFNGNGLSLVWNF